MKKKTLRNTSRDNAAIRKKKFERAFGNLLFQLAWLIPVIGATYGTCSIIEKCNQEKRDAAMVEKQQNKNKPKNDAGQSKKDPKIQGSKQE